MIKQDRSDKSSSIDLRPLHQALGGRRGHQALGGKQGHQGETDLKKVLLLVFASCSWSTTWMRMKFK